MNRPLDDTSRPAVGDSPVQRLLARLEGVTRTPNGWDALCPAHDDHRPSLGVAEGADGRALVCCRSRGCRVDDVVAAVGLEAGDLFASREAVRAAVGKTGLGPVVATYDYTDPQGRLLYQVTRHRPKTFRQRRPDGRGGWVHSLAGVARVPYRLPAVLAAPLDVPVFVVEGEKDADALAALGLVATTNAQGAGKWKTLDPDTAEATFRGRNVVILPDNDTPGRQHAADVAARLAPVAASVKVLNLPGLPPKGDTSDWLAAGGTAKKLLDLVRSTATWSPPAAVATDGPHAGAEGGRDAGPVRKGAGTRLVEIAIAAGAELFHSPDRQAHATVPVNGHRETWHLRGAGFRLWLTRLYYEAEGKAPGAQAVQDALGVLEGEALFRGGERPVAVRVAERDGAIYLDLADAGWRAVRVDAGGWAVITDPPVRFVRPRGLLPLPEPARGGRLDDLRTFINLRAGERDWRLLAGWLQQALRGRGPYPVLVLRGQQGSAKSTAARLVRGLIDPNQAALRTTPRDERDLAIAATNGWVVALDNLSGLADWASDALCRLSTGGGFTTRQLYADRDEVIFDYQRPCILTAIEDVVGRGDLIDRAIQIDLEPIPDDRRQTEQELYAAFDRVRPATLGGLLDTVAAGLACLPTVRATRLPRLADFALWAEACHRGAGGPAGQFLGAYNGSRADANQAALDGSVLVPPLLRLLERDGEFLGPASELLTLLTDLADPQTTRGREWPTRPNALSNRLRRLAPNLRQAGIAVEFAVSPAIRNGPRRLRIAARPDGGAEPSSAPSAPSAAPETLPATADGADDLDRLRTVPNPSGNATETARADGADGADDGSQPDSADGCGEVGWTAPDLDQDDVAVLRDLVRA
jgi:hypothetical protein